MKRFTASLLALVCILSGCSVIDTDRANPTEQSNTPEIEIELPCSTIDAEYQITDGSLYDRGHNFLRLFGDDDTAVFTEWVEIVDANNIIHIEAINGTTYAWGGEYGSTPKQRG